MKGQKAYKGARYTRKLSKNAGGMGGYNTTHGHGKIKLKLSHPSCWLLYFGIFAHFPLAYRIDFFYAFLFFVGFPVWWMKFSFSIIFWYAWILKSSTFAVVYKCTCSLRTTKNVLRNLIRWLLLILLDTKRLRDNGFDTSSKYAPIMDSSDTVPNLLFLIEINMVP